MKSDKVSKLPTSNFKLQHDGRFTIATASSRLDLHWKNSEVSYSEFLQRMSRTVQTQETVSEYRKMSKAKQGDIKDVGGFVGGSLKDGKRRAGSVAWRQLITLDADFIKGDFFSGTTMLFDHACAIYSTHKHTAENPRMRLIIPLTRPVTAEEYLAVSKKVADIIGIDFFDDTTYQPHRLFYWPSTSRDGDFVFDYQDAEWLNPDEILAMYNDWTDPLEWPVSSRADSNHKRLADKQGDPLTKPGLVGLFNRAYAISEAIETFLSDVYEEAGDERYTFIGGSTQGGFVTYNDVFGYSHHGTDPCSEKLVNSFDMLRLHRFGALDDDSKENTPVNKLPSYAAMQEFAQNDAKVKIALASEKMESALSDFADEWQNVDSTEQPTKAAEKESNAWMSKLEINGHGEIVPNARNIDLILENSASLKGCFGWDRFQRQPTVTRDLPWRKIEDAGPLWNNGDDEELRNYLDMVYGIRSSQNKIADVLGGVMRKHGFHPVKRYLESAEWDGEPRVETLLIDFLGAEDSTYSRAVTRKTLVAAVARIFEPGIKFDYMLTLVGEQGLGKSMLFNKLGGAWFSDSITNIQGKEGYEALQGVWILEMAELAATSKSEVEAVKQFISKRVDRYRAAYGRRVEEHPRQCIIIGTTNESDFLKDRTGNRRYWPVPVSRERMKRDWHTLNEDEIGQIWAEAMVIYKDGEALYLDGLEADKAAEMQLAHVEVSPYEGLIKEFVDRKVPATWATMSLLDRRLFLNDEDTFADEFDTDDSTFKVRDRICSMEIWCELLGNSKSKFPQMDRREINGILRKLDGWEPHNSKQGTVSFGKNYGVQRAYVRVNSQEK